MSEEFRHHDLILPPKKTNTGYEILTWFLLGFSIGAAITLVADALVDALL